LTDLSLSSFSLRSFSLSLSLFLTEILLSPSQTFSHRDPSLTNALAVGGHPDEHVDVLSHEDALAVGGHPDQHVAVLSHEDALAIGGCSGGDQSVTSLLLLLTLPAESQYSALLLLQSSFSLSLCLSTLPSSEYFCLLLKKK
jgi:hypothetical protein